MPTYYIPYVDVLSTISEASCESRFPTSSSENSLVSSFHRRAPSSMGSSRNVYVGMGRTNLMRSSSSVSVRKRSVYVKRTRLQIYRDWLTYQRETIEELRREARGLTSLQKRQEAALDRYEKAKTETPRLLRRYEEELVFWEKYYRSLNLTNIELRAKLKEKEDCVLMAGRVNEYYLQLDEEQHLKERDRLTGTLKTLKLRLQTRQQIKEKLLRKIESETKFFQQRLAKKSQKIFAALHELQKKKDELAKLNESDGTDGQVQKDVNDGKLEKLDNENPHDEKANGEKETSKLVDNAAKVSADLKNLSIE